MTHFVASQRFTVLFQVRHWTTEIRRKILLANARYWRSASQRRRITSRGNAVRSAKMPYMRLVRSNCPSTQERFRAWRLSRGCCSCLHHVIGVHRFQSSSCYAWLGLSYIRVIHVLKSLRVHISVSSARNNDNVLSSMPLSSKLKTLARSLSIMAYGFLDLASILSVSLEHFQVQRSSTEYHSEQRYINIYDLLF